MHASSTVHTSSSNYLIGAHVSASGGVDKALARAAALGCTAVQVFSGSPRVWVRPSLESINVEAIRKAQQKYGIQPIVTHALYLVNLASEKPENLQKSHQGLKFDLEFDAKIGGKGVVVHLGSHQGRGWEAVRDQVAEGISRLLAETPAESTFLIENSAGQNGKLTSDLHDIRWLLDQINSPRLGWCFDTCHGFAAGYVLSTKQEVPYQDGASTLVESVGQGQLVTDVISELNLWQSLKVIHVNGSRDAFASGKDRHANLGEGELTPDTLKGFFNAIPDLNTIPLILEVPGFDKEGPDKDNVDRLKELVP
jgi:deoxyribonuclease-4